MFFNRTDNPNLTVHARNKSNAKAPRLLITAGDEDQLQKMRHWIDQQNPSDTIQILFN